jgi:hypothetical protein
MEETQVEEQELAAARSSKGTPVQTQMGKLALGTPVALDETGKGSCSRRQW